MLFGFMGTGKTVLAHLLGDRLGRPVMEMDDLIEEREGMKIGRIFAEQGEEYFRIKERELIRDLSREGGKIIATGGGVVLNQANIRDLEKNGILICLTARPEVILQRVADQTHRPLLESADRLETINQLLEERRPLYELIDHQIDTSDLTVNEVLERVLIIAGYSRP